MHLIDRIDAIGARIHTLVSRLEDRGFRFRSPDEVLPGPEAGTAQAIARIEREAGELPLALKLFWGRIGGVDFCGQHPEWVGAEYPDPLVVFPPSIALDELDQFLSDREERLRHSFPYLDPIAPDDYHKEEVSGGMWYNVSMPAVADDPPLNDEWHHTTFVGYLAIAIIWGGFPGLARYPGHHWPIEELTRGILMTRQSRPSRAASSSRVGRGITLLTCLALIAVLAVVMALTRSWGWDDWHSALLIFIVVAIYMILDYRE